MFANITSSVVEVLTGAGINAGRAYPKAAIVREDGCFVRARVESVKQGAPGFANYLGLETGAEGVEWEVYGRRCKMELALDIYAFSTDGKAAEAGEALVDDIIFALGGCSGLSIGSVSCGGARPDRDTGAFLCPCKAELDVLLTLRCEDENVQFSDFILKGEIKK